MGSGLLVSGFGIRAEVLGLKFGVYVLGFEVQG